jgi:hypothetical protein
MTRLIMLLAGATVVAVALSDPGFPLGAPQTMSLMNVGLTGGHRAPKIMRNTVHYGSMGTIGDLAVVPPKR